MRAKVKRPSYGVLPAHEPGTKNPLASAKPRPRPSPKRCASATAAVASERRTTALVRERIDVIVHAQLVRFVGRRDVVPHVRPLPELAEIAVEVDDRDDPL